jgi:SAM-dependent methyltransferase
LRSLIFRGTPLVRRLLGPERTLRALLQIERASWRLAYEAAIQRYGEAFMNNGLAIHREQLEHWMPAGAAVLDIGCRDGRHGRLIADRVSSYLGIDLLPDVIFRAQGEPHSLNVRFEVGDARALPPGAFDIAIASHLIEHLDDPEEFLRDIGARVPRLIVEVPDFDHDLLNAVRLDIGVDFSSDDDHVREYTSDLLEQQLTATGWKVVDRARSPISIAVLAVRPG